MTDKLAFVRANLTALGCDAFICPIANRFLTKNVLPHDNLVAWLTGASPQMSFGTVVVTATRAGLFTAPLYEEMVRAEVDKNAFALFTEGTEDFFVWLSENLPSGAKIGFDPWLYSVQDIEKMEKQATEQGLQLVPVAKNPITPDTALDIDFPVTPHDVAFHGMDADEKFNALRLALTKAKIDRFVLGHGPSLSWLLNLRVPQDQHNPTIRAYAIVHVAQKSITLYCDQKLDGLLPDFVRQRPLADCEHLSAQLGSEQVAFDTHTTPAAFRALAFKPFMDPCLWLKAKKNAKERAGIRASHTRDAVALCKTLAWIDREQGTIGEIDVARKLLEERQKGEHFRGLSFPAIVGFNAHGASIHHATRDDNSQRIEGNGLLLIDSGGQYDDGTTDVTRTVAIGTPSADMKLAFTHVLKSHIAISNAKFPEGTTGAQLDGIARAPLWDAGYDYRHGTGHGVGYWLNVHEGPFSLSYRCADGVVPDLLLSIEPGYYQSGAFGIRLENLALTVLDPEPTRLDKSRLKFEPVTLAPFDTRCLLPQMLNDVEIAWLNLYHQQVRYTVLPYLDGADADWLVKQTEEL